MAYQLHLLCHTCGTDLKLSVSALTKNEPTPCLKCGATINTDLWNRLVSVFWILEEINHDFYKYHLEKDEPQFSVRITDSELDSTY